VRHILIILSILLLSSPLFGQSKETCYVSVEGSKEFNLNLFSQISKSLISQYFKPVKNIPPGGISSDSCVYEITVTKEGDTTFVVFSGEDLNAYGDSKLYGSDGFQQSLLKSLYRSLEDKRKKICEDYGELLKKCGSVVVQDVPKKVTITKVEPKVVEIPKKVKETVVHKTEEDKTKGLFVTVGDKGTILTSSDGISWTPRESGTSEHLHGITNKNGVFVTVGGKGIILTSSDGISWTSRYGTLNGNKSSAWLFGICHGNGLFVAVGDKGTIFTSLDGTQWTSRNIKVDMYGDEVPITEDEFKGVNFGNGLFVTVSWNGTIFTSPDGIIWTERQIVNTKQLVPLLGVTYGSEIFVAVGHEETILTSKDGVSWTQVRTGTYHLNNVIYKNGLFLSSGTDGRTLNSSNGLRWEVMTPETKVDLFGVSYGKREFVFVGKNGTVRTSPDGIGWTSRTSGTTENL